MARLGSGPLRLYSFTLQSIWRAASTACAFGLALSISPASRAQLTPDDGVFPLPETSAKESVLSQDALLGEDIDLNTGDLSFHQTDLEIPGPKSLPLRISRSYKVSDWSTARIGTSINGWEFGDWELDLPRVTATFTVDQQGWPEDVCTGLLPDAITVATGGNVGGGPPSQTNIWKGSDYTSGYHLEIPSYGSQQMLTRQYVGSQTGNPSGTAPGSAPIVTTGNWQITCLSNAKNASGAVVGEGFIATSPAGVKYTFNLLRSRTLPPMKAGTINLADYHMMATKVEDVDGNTLTYTYNTSGRLTSITANDGRSLSIAYNSDGYISTVTSGGRSWSYAYGLTDSGSRDTLTQVTRPDGSKWKFDLEDLTVPVDATDPTKDAYRCTAFENPYTRNGTVTNPYGLTASYRVQCKRHGVGAWTHPTYRADSPNFSTTALIRKQYSHPATGTDVWTYTYTNPAGWSVGETGASTKTLTIANPDGSSDIFQLNMRRDSAYEGRVTNHVTKDSAGNEILEEANTHTAGALYGYLKNVRLNQLSNTRWIRTKKVITTQDASTYTFTNSTFDAYGFVTGTSETNSFAGSRVTATSYAHNLTKWIFGLQSAHTIDGLDANSATYDTEGHLINSYRHGLRTSTVAYAADGQVSSRKDGLNRTTTYTDYYRGSPRTITRPGSAVTEQTLDAFGATTSATDARGNTTSFQRDGLGRLIGVTFPTADTVAWSSPTITYQLTTVAENGLPAGTWKSVYDDGRLVRRTYYDGSLRPLLVQERDDSTAVTQYDRFEYDYAGRMTFKAYASNSATFASGLRFTYDALGRLTKKATTDSISLETVSWLSGNRRRVVDATNATTTYTYQAFGTPAYDLLLKVEAPEGQTTTLDRDSFGYLQSATQAGGSVTRTRAYLYDANYRLCKRIDPESGQHVIAYDAASQIIWTADGQAGSTTACDHASVPAAAKIQYGYSVRGLRASVNYADSSGDIALGYDLDDNLLSVTNGTANWTYSWNKRGLLESETAAIDGKSWVFDLKYNVLGLQSQLIYPDGRATSYSPDAWGRPTQLSGVLSGVTYHPNDIVSAYSMANGLAYSSTLNSRRWPQVQLVDGTGFAQEFTYAYNNAGDITSITDGVDGVDGVTMTYDGLHRLRNATGVWGSYTHNYDAINNLTSRTGTDALTYTYASTTGRLSGVSGAVSRAYTYDAEGRVKTDGQRTYTWNQADRITGITGVATYAYDGHGQRIKTTKSDGSIEYTLYNLAGQLLYAEKGTEKTDFYFLKSVPVGEIKTVGSTTTKTYLHADLLGSPRRATSASGVSLWREHYAPYGEKLNGVSERIGYTGHAHDMESGLTYMQARHYDPAAGRFLSTDPHPYLPEDSYSFNRYAYANNNPYKFTDPDGEFAIPFLGALIWAIGALIHSEPANAPTSEDDVERGDGLAAIPGATGVKTTATVVNAAKGEPPQLARGKRAHQQEPVRPGERPEVSTPSGKRMDRYDADKAHIREIKPDNPRGMKQGERQVEGYKREMEQATRRPHTTEVSGYDPKKYE